MPDATSTNTRTMQCMEVWGGTRAADNGVVMPGLDAWVFAQPFEGDDSGGDIHYLSSCATGRIVRLLIADVAGHGHTVAQLAERLRSVMRRYLNYVDQRTVVSEINREFADVAELGRFATAILVTCWTPTDEIALTNAGHPPPIHYDARRKRWKVLEHGIDRSARPGPPRDEPRNLPLGIGPAGYDEHRLRLASGDLLLLYSDSLIEAQAPSGELLGPDGLVGLLESLDPAEPQRLITDLRAAIARITQSDASADDTTIMILRTNALKPRGGLLTGLRAGSRLASNLIDSLRTGERFAMPEVNPRNIAGAFVDRLNRR